MIEHTVCFTLKHLPGSDEEAAFLRFARGVLPGVPGVERFRVARQVSIQSEYRWQFSMVFASEDDYAAYNAHPEHQAFVRDRWLTEVDSFQELDFVPEPDA